MRRIRKRPALDGDDRLLEPERGEQAGGVEPARQLDGGALKLRREPAGVHRVDPVDIGDGGRRGGRVRERDHVAVADAKRARRDRVLVAPAHVLVSGIVFSPAVDRDVDGDHVTTAVGEVLGDAEAVAATDLQESVEPVEFGHERTT